jgi:hypothetical protein
MMTWGCPEGINEFFNGAPELKLIIETLIKFTSNRVELYDTIFRMTSKLMNPLQ